MDFKNNLNTVVTWNNLGSNPTCWKGPCGWLPPLEPTFLRDNHAIYGGTENTKFDGECEKWQFLAKGSTFFTFYFNKFQQLTRFNFVSYDPNQQEVGVNNQFFNVVTGNSSLLPPAIFSGSGNCPNGSVEEIAKTEISLTSLFATDEH